MCSVDQLAAAPAGWNPRKAKAASPRPILDNQSFISPFPFCGQPASSHITGKVLPIIGGYSDPRRKPMMQGDVELEIGEGLIQLLLQGHSHDQATNRRGSNHDLECALCLLLGGWRLSKCFQLGGNASPPWR